MQEVADRAGVSLKTVSNVVNNFASIRPSTRARVQQALTELGYRPNLAARSLARGRTGLIAVMLPDLELSFYGRLGSTLIAEAQRGGLVAVFYPSGGTTPGEVDTLELLRHGLVDGLIATSLGMSDTDLRARIGPLPTVMLGERWGPDQVFDHVRVDLEEAGRLAVRHLLELGRSRIALIGPRRDDFGPTDGRLRGALETLAEAGLEATTVADIGPYDRRHGYWAMKAIVDAAPAGRRPDAAFCFNDDLAFGAIAALHDAGLSCPQDVAVVGCDDDVHASFAVPAVTSIRHSHQRLAARLIERLQLAIARAERLTDDGSPGVAPAHVPADIVIGQELVVRNSTVADHSGLRAPAVPVRHGSAASIAGDLDR